MKRDYLDTDSEDDDDSKRYDSAPQTVARKKRRGVIEKRRRDRINNSLSELRRMVPTAYEKHGSAKLEKAEILQLTVEHLKTLQSAISKGYFPFVDVHSMAVDYRSFGFRECVSEVAKYMVTSDPTDTQVPIRNKLLNHLQNMLSQKEAAGAMTKAAPVSIPPWSSIPALNNVINPGSNVITPGNNVISPGMLPHRHNLPSHREHPAHMTPQLHLPLSPAFLLSDRRPARLEASMFSPKRKLPPHLDTRTSPFASTMLTPAFQPRSHHLFSKASNDHFGIFTNFGSFPTRKHDRYFNPAKDSAFREIPPIETQPTSDPEKNATTNLSSTPPPKRATKMDTPPHRPWSLELSAH